MRVCIFGSEIGWVKREVCIGGAQASAMRLAEALYSLGDEVFVFSSAPRGKPSGLSFTEWGTVINKRIIGRYMSLPYVLVYGAFSFFGLLHFCRRNRIEIINTHSGTFALCLIPSLVGKILKIPVIHTQYCEVLRSKNHLLELLEQTTIRFGSVAPNRFCGISKNVCSSLLSCGVPKLKVKRLPPVIAVKNISADLPKRRDSFGFSNNDSVALFIGNLKKNKGIDILIDAFINLAPKFSNLKLIITTELVHENFFSRKNRLQEKLAKHGLTDRVIWLGFVDDIISLIKEVDVVVVPFLDLKGISDYPLVLLEALSVNTPIIATDVGGVREVLNADSGILIPPGDVEALSRGIQSLAFEKESGRRVLAKGSPIECFSANTIGREYHSLFLKEKCSSD